ncbi:MAG: copper amine oxidase N-terminal domain-containing protein [Clostridia bacterium]|nr:copper amine oxidase N-terminal domain-containing protein [Clostridia bacterium]
MEGRTYTPVRFIAEALGAKVSWNAETKEVTITK